MSGVAQAFFFVYGPVILVCGLAYLWSRLTMIGWLSKLLRRSAVFWGAWLLIVLVVAVLPPYFCEGSALYSYNQCRVISDGVANLVNGLAILSYLVGIIYGVILFSAAGLTSLLALPPDPDA
ncbi:hypothetical protein SAMN04488515_1663 [Cognatiyoonia koreensis]|uniref:Uncharacterized protein n=1 Tax=Cognatiyoonia koreensis TaxID=364200 RepID=A0A1I0Q509_9RHOB|nr:hypothetical protein [Cognatiyoonia koreensis]SEW21856.1 hypothetical protein SAMN04488515_1663 [Cognatiyoonia koreensis]